MMQLRELSEEVGLCLYDCVSVFACFCASVSVCALRNKQSQKDCNNLYTPG